LDTRVARYFAAIAQHSSIRDAADDLNVAQSALSRQILKLEDEFGVTLFQRHARGIALTVAGEVYLRYAREQMAQVEHLRGELAALNGVQRGTVRIAAIESLTRSLLPPLIAKFHHRYPAVRFDIKMDGSERILDSVREIDTDIGMTYYSQPASDLEVRFSMPEPVVAIVAAGHPLTKRRRVDLREVAAYPTALTTTGSRSRNLVDTACWKAGISLAPVLESNSVEPLIGLVQRSETVALLLKMSVTDALNSGRLVAIDINSEILPMGRIEVVTRIGRKLSPVGEEFLAFLASELTANSAAGKGKKLRRSPARRS